ncbi:hypothetical protein NDU88_011961 [Pleurodeles waltl]|uniref:Uncharacterized protein n=1 Tax=Pleurodeles waltl TaxID=8319 RepID=A0AAV7S479_PLEWA|nr:hypothetical protein NDU88_011961 [Pleurodeles waltl]
MFGLEKRICACSEPETREPETPGKNSAETGDLYIQSETPQESLICACTTPWTRRTRRKGTQTGDLRTHKAALCTWKRNSGSAHAQTQRHGSKTLQEELLCACSEPETLLPREGEQLLSACSERPRAEVTSGPGRTLPGGPWRLLCCRRHHKAAGSGPGAANTS